MSCRAEFAGEHGSWMSGPDYPALPYERATLRLMSSTPADIDRYGFSLRAYVAVIPEHDWLEVHCHALDNAADEDVVSGTPRDGARPRDSVDPGELACSGSIDFVETLVVEPFAMFCGARNDPCRQSRN